LLAFGFAVMAHFALGRTDVCRGLGTHDCHGRGKDEGRNNGDGKGSHGRLLGLLKPYFQYIK
jgi:hypothetical protein